jgi:NAD(P)-dependent dehydrogenase (short-subunit alcohol dehydrogenase family)
MSHAEPQLEQQPEHQPAQHLQQSSALVTGGASGLGAAVARHLAAQGARVVLADLNAEEGLALAAQLGGVFAATDVRDSMALAAAVAAASSQAEQPLRLLVCCAGLATAERTLAKDGSPLALERFARVIEVNLIGTFNAIRLAASQMSLNTPDQHGQRGVIVCTASVAAFDGQIGQAADSASKGGIAAMTLPLAREFARLGIRVVTVAPGIFDTPLLAGLPEAARQSLGAQVPFPSRLGQPQEFAALVGHIIENPMLNGEVIRLDGALRMAPR